MKEDGRTVTPNNRLLDILDSIDAYFYSLDANWNIVYVSKRMANDFGYEPVQLLGKNFWETFPRFIGTEIERNFVESMKEHEIKHFEWKTIYVKDSYREFTVFPSTDGITVYGKDITQRKKAEEALKESEQLYRTLFDNSQDGFQLLELIFDKRGQPVDLKYLRVNSAFESMVGFKAQDIIGKTAREVFPNYGPEWLEIPQKVLESGKSLHTELYSAPINKYLDLYYFNYGKNVVGAFFRDVTERKKAEASVLSERKRFFDVLETMPVMVCLINSDYHTPFANRAFREKFGESLGRCCYEYCAGQNAPCEFCESLLPLKTGKPHHWIFNYATKVIDAYDYPFTDIDGSLKILEVDIDITDRVKLEKELQNKERLAAIGATAGMVGHDIRNPLQAMLGDIYLMKGEIASAPECKTKEGLTESLASLEENISYVNKIVQDLQDYARPVTPEFSVVALSKVFTRVFETVIVPQSIKLSIKIRDLEKVRVDSTLLQRALSNLVTNAVQAMPNGGNLEITGFPTENTVVITVSDTGHGIPEEIKPKLFTPMMTTKAKGQGFGLAVSKRLIEAMKGSISFESTEGKGTKFIIKLPISA